MRGSQLLFVFYEQKAEKNNFTLDRSHRQATMGMRTLSRAREIYIHHPDLEEAPKPVAVTGGEAATAADLAWLEEEGGAFDEELLWIEELGVAGPTHRPVWLHLQLPDEAPLLDALSGRVSLQGGEVVSTFRIAAEALDAGPYHAYHLTFPLDEGAYRIEVAGTSGGDLQVLHRFDAEVTEVPPGEWISPVWLGRRAERAEDAPRGSAFNFGGWHLIPLAGGSVSKEAEFPYFGFVVRPTPGPGGDPDLQLKLTLTRDGTRLGSPLRLDVPSVALGADLSMFANALNLSGLPEAGTYGLTLQVKDRTTGVSSSRQLSLEIVD